MTPIMEAFRWIFLGVGSWRLAGLLYSASVAAAVLLVGLLLFNRSEANFVDTV
jgi:lipopolysaccharide transport system permease protein